MTKPEAPHLSEKGQVWCEVSLKDVKTFFRPDCQGGKWYLAKAMRIDRIIDEVGQENIPS